MYGSIFRMKVKSGQEQKLAELMKEWETEQAPKIEGAIATLVLKPDRQSGELVAVAVFKDKASYKANAERPEQDRWFRRMRELLEADPEWEDGEYLVTQGIG